MASKKHMHSASGTALDKAVAAEELVHTECQKVVFALLKSSTFEHVMSIIIMANFIMIVMETDIAARDEETPLWMDASSWLVLVLFIVELAGRIYTQGKHFWTDSFNLFDFVVVAVDVLFSSLAVIFGSMFPVSFLRIFRLCKVARVSKIFRVFPELRLMMAGLMGAMSAIFWGAVLLTFALIVWSIIAVQFIHPLATELDQQGVFVGCERCGKSFANVASAVLTFCQQIVAGDSWGLVTIPIIEHYPAAAVYFAAVFLTVGMAVLNLMLAVCVDVATQARSGLMKEMAQEKLLTQEKMTMHLIRVCKEMDSDNSGELTKAELMDGFENNADFQNTMKELEVQREDLDIVWIIMDSDKSGLVSYTEFIAQLLSMRSSDTTFMLAYIKYYITVIREKMAEDMSTLQKDLQEDLQMQRKLQATTEKEVAVHAQESAKLDSLLSKFDGSSTNQLILQESRAQQVVSNGIPGPPTPVGGSSPVPMGGSPMLVHESKETTQLFRSSDMQIFEDLMKETRCQQAELMTAVKEIAVNLSVRPQFNVRPSSSLDATDSTLWPSPGFCPRPCSGNKTVVQTDRQLLAVPPELLQRFDTNQSAAGYGSRADSLRGMPGGGGSIPWAGQP